jgi:glutathione synthase/RimK-type ligase-like ATP-grasp enzyme
VKVRIIPYKRGSKSAKILAEKMSNLLGYKVFRGQPRINRFNIFWGWIGNFVNVPWFMTNNPTAIAKARDKLLTFQELQAHEIPIPEYTTDKAQAEGWLSSGKTVLARTRTGQGGRGIAVCSDSLVDAPLYTLYIKKKKEFRVHVVDGEAILVQQKRKRRGEIPDPLIRSHRRGWVFCQQDIEEPAGLRELGVAAVNSLGLDFGAVDIIYNEKKDKLFVLEVNTAPGLCNQTGDLYASSLANTL